MWLKKDENGKPNGGYLQSLLLSHRPVREPAPGLHAGDRLLPQDGPRHDPGRPRGRAGPARAQLDVRRRAAQRRPADHLSPDLRAGGARVRPHRLLHDQAVHGRLGLWLPPQHVAVARRRGRVRQRCGNDPTTLPGMARQLHVSSRAARTPSCPTTTIRRCRARSGCRPSAAWSSICGALTAIGCSTVNSYRRLWDTGFWAPVFADWGFQNRTTGLRVSAPGRFEYRSVDSMVNPYLMGGGASQGHGRRHRATSSIRASRRSATSTRRWRPASRSRSCRCRWATRSTRWQNDEVIKLGHAGRDVPALSRVQDATSGSASCTPSPSGTRKPTWTACPDRRTRRPARSAAAATNRRRRSQCAELQD